MKTGTDWVFWRSGDRRGTGQGRPTGGNGAGLGGFRVGRRCRYLATDANRCAQMDTESACSYSSYGSQEAADDLEIVGILTVFGETEAHFVAAAGVKAGLEADEVLKFLGQGVGDPDNRGFVSAVFGFEGGLGLGIGFVSGILVVEPGWVASGVAAWAGWDPELGSFLRGRRTSG